MIRAWTSASVSDSRVRRKRTSTRRLFALESFSRSRRQCFIFERFEGDFLLSGATGDVSARDRVAGDFLFAFFLYERPRLTTRGSGIVSGFRSFRGSFRKILPLAFGSVLSATPRRTNRGLWKTS